MVRLKEMPYCLDEDQIVWVEETLTGMSVEEKAGQLFLPVYTGNFEATVKELEKCGLKPGGFYLRVTDADTLRATIEKLQSHAEIPLLIAADLDRGPCNQIAEGTALGCEMAIAACKEPALAYQAGLACARETHAAGINWDFGPVVDIDYNYRNPATNIRTFGSDPETVKENAVAYAKGLRDGGLLSCMKHWPGDGRDERDQHFLASVNDCSVEEWDETYGMVFKAMIDSGTETLMSAQIMLPAYSRYYRPDIRDEEILPGSLNADLHSRLLREKLGFNGLIVTDASSMAGFTEVLPRRMAVPVSIAGGADIFLFNRNKGEDFAFMMEGIKRGIISEERLNDAVRRILGLKAKQRLPERKASGQLIPDRQETKWIGCESHRQLAENIADKGITLVKDTQKLLPLNPDRIRKIFLIVLGDTPNYHNKQSGYGEVFRRQLEKEGFEVKLYDPELIEHEYDRLPVSEFTKRYDLVIYFVNRATDGQESAVRLYWPGERREAVPTLLSDMPVMMISVDNPYHLADVPRMRTYINAYTSSEITIEKLTEKLMGRSPFRGVSPVDPFCGLFNAKY